MSLDVALRRASTRPLDGKLRAIVADTIARLSAAAPNAARRVAAREARATAVHRRAGRRPA